MKSEEDIIQEDSTPSPPSKVGLTTGVRLGLSGLVDTEDLIQRALGTSDRFEGKEYPEDSPPSSGTPLDFSKFCFGFKIAGAVVTISGGDWPIGEPAPLELADTNVTISQDGQYVGLEVDTIYKTITVIGPSVTKAFFNPDAQKFRCWLHQFNYSGGKVSMKRTRLGSLFMPSTFGAEP